MPRGVHSIPSSKPSNSLPKPTSSTTAIMEKHDREMKKKINYTKETTNNNHNKNVLIAVYVESPSPSNTQIPQRINTPTDPIKKIKPKPPPSSKNPRTAKARGYDRRAQLLAYSQELRNADSQQVQWPKNGSRPKPKVSFSSGLYSFHACNQCRRAYELYISLKILGFEQSSKGKRLTTPVRLHRTKNGKKYQRLVQAVDVSCSPKCIIRRKKKASKSTDSQILVNKS